MIAHLWGACISWETRDDAHQYRPMFGRSSQKRLASFSLNAGVFASLLLLEISTIDTFRLVQGPVQRTMHVSFIRKTSMASFRPLATRKLRPHTPGI